MKKQFGTILRTFNKHSTLPILDNALILGPDVIISDLNTELRFKNLMPMMGKNAKIMVNAKKLAHALNNISPLHKVDITRGNELILSDRNNSFQLSSATTPADNIDGFPLKKNSPDLLIPPNRYGKIGISDIRKIKKIVPFTDDYEFRPVLCAVYYQNDRLVASDAHVLIQLPATKLSGNFLIPRDVARIIGMFEMDFNVNQFSENSIQFISDSLEIIFRPVDGNYPTWESIFPKKQPHFAYIEKAVLIRELKRVEPYAGNASKLCKFKFEQDSIKLEVDDLDFELSAKSELPAFSNPHADMYGIKIPFLLRCLNAIDSDIINLQFEHPSNALVINGQILIMPMMING